MLEYCGIIYLSYFLPCWLIFNLMSSYQDRITRQQDRRKYQNKTKQCFEKKSEQELLENIEDLEKYIFNTEISSINSMDVQKQYYPGTKKNIPIKNIPSTKSKNAHSDRHRSIDREDFHKGPISPQSQQMVLVPKRKLLKIFEEVKMLKKALKSQQRMMNRELESMRYGVQDLNKQKALLLRQRQYLKDMQRSASEGKNTFYKTQSKLNYNKKYKC